MSRSSEELSIFIIDLYLQLEQQILDNIGISLAMPEAEVNITDWQRLKLQQLGKLTNENLKYLAGISGKSVEAIKELIQLEGAEGAALVDGYLGASAVALTASPVLANTLVFLEAQAVDKLNLVNTSMLRGAQQVYLNIINETTAKAITGLVTPQQALRETAAKWAEHGIPTIRDKSGRIWSTEAYVPMVIRATRKKVSSDMQIARMEDHNIDLIEVSSKMGARPKCEPYQGKIFSKSGRSKKYPAWSTTSYGEPDGLLGINCGHVIYPYVEGKSIKRYSPYPKAANDKAYKESQQQRSIERAIRKKKKALQMATAMGDEVGIKRSRKQVRHQQERMREFIKATGRGRKPNREQIV